MPAAIPPQPSPQAADIVRRVALLLLCVAAGVCIGAVGQALTGQPGWWLALPLCMLAGWLRVADPLQCTPPPPDRAGVGRDVH